MGESPNDTEAVKALWEKYYSDTPVEFCVHVQRVRGSDLDSQGTKRVLRKEYEVEKPSLVVFIRDLDALQSDKAKVKTRKEWFTSLNSVCDNNGLLLLNIFEIEAWLLADTSALNQRFNVSINAYDTPENIVEPKELLIKLTKNSYSEHHCRELIPLLDVELLKAKLPQYQKFSEAFEAQL